MMYPQRPTFNAMFADAVSGNVATEESTSSTSYVALATPGPSATITLVTGQQVMILISALMINQTSGGGSLASFATSGGATIASNDTNAAWTRSTERTMASRQAFYVASASASFTFTMQYKIEASGTAAFASRRINLMKR